MENSQRAIRKQIGDICFHMKGGIPWNDAWGLSFIERDELVKSINDKLRKMSGDTREFM